MIIIVAMGIGLFMPPFGVGFYTACAIGKVNAEAAMRALWGYLGILIVGLALLVIFPWFSTGFLTH